MITVTKLPDGVLRITSDQGGVFAHNLSGDYVLPSGIVSVSEPKGDDRQWYAVDIESQEIETLITRNNRGSANDELMWVSDGSYFYVDGDELSKRNDITSFKLPFSNSNVQWRAGSASCHAIQFVKGETASGTFLQSFNAKTGELLDGFWLQSASQNQARKARNVVRFTHGEYGEGYLVSSQEDASHEHFVTLSGKSWRHFEGDDTNGAARWSHAATWGETFVACRPFTGSIETYGRDGIREIVSQEQLKALTGAKRFPQWFHGSTNGEVVVFSVLEGQTFLGIYGLDLKTHETWEIREANNLEIRNDDFASMARPAITLDGKHVVWHERPGVVYVAPVRVSVVPPEPPVDELAELTKRVERLELIIYGIHGVTKIL
jgi:hypothetical protein